MDHPSADDPFWKPLDFSDALTLDIPILFLDQWYDYATSHLVAEFEYRQEAGLPSRLDVGPGTHFSSDATQLEETLRWFDQHLKGGKPPAGTSVRVFVLPDVGWRDLAHWPPAGEPDTWFLAPGGALSREPCAIGDPTHYQYDAADPTPALGGPSLRMEHCGPRDNRPLEARDDVLTFTSPPLQAEAFTEGRVGVDLYLRSDVDHFDLYLRLCDVAPSGESINMSEELRRLTPGDIWRGHDGVFVISVELRPVAYRFAIGHCIRLQVSGGAHPMFARNTCSGEPVADATTIVVAHNAIYHDELHPSRGLPGPPKQSARMSTGTLVLGVLNGLIISLLAVGFVLVYKANRFLNLASAQLGVLSALLLLKAVNDWGWNWWLTFVACVVMGIATGVLVERFVIAPVRRRTTSPVRPLILTIGVSQVLLGLTYIPGLAPVSQAPFPQPFGSNLQVGGVVLSGMSLLTLIAVPVLLLLLTLFLEFTSIGKQIRAAAGNPDAARLCGISGFPSELDHLGHCGGSGGDRRDPERSYHRIIQWRGPRAHSY